MTEYFIKSQIFYNPLKQRTQTYNSFFIKKLDILMHRVY